MDVWSVEERFLVESNLCVGLNKMSD